MKATAALAAVVLAVVTACSFALQPGAERDGDARARDCPRAPAYPAPAHDRVRYDIDMRLGSSARLVTGRLRAEFRPDRPTRRLVFRLWPNGPQLASSGARLEVGAVTAHGRRAMSRLEDPTTLIVDLDDRLAAGERVVVALPWRLTVPGAVVDRIASAGRFVHLGSFFPLLAWEPGRGWATEPATTALGETSSSPTADFSVRIDAPSDLDVLATGEERAPGRWIARAVRDFAVAVGPFEVVSSVVRAPDPVTVTVGGPAGGLGPPPRAFLARVEAALRDLSRRYGPYPWPTLSLAVVPGLEGVGIEYPTMIFQGPESLERATTHEVAHSWFYALAGNNQARDPWLDEGLTSWAQARADGILHWFRDFVIPSAVRGRLGAPMSYWERNEANYYAGVYAQGVRALDALGPARLVDCALRLYVARNAYGIADPDDFTEAVGDVFPRGRRTLLAFGAFR